MRNFVFLILFCALNLSAQDDPGRKSFEDRCAKCHGADARGGELGPPIAARLASRNATQLAAVIREGMPGTGMPPNPVSDSEMPALIRHLRTLQPRGGFNRPVIREKVQTTSGKTLDGQVLGQGFYDMQLRTGDGRVHLLRRAAGGQFREVTSETNWPSYNGRPDGNRYTTLDQINKSNVARLGPQLVRSEERRGGK